MARVGEITQAFVSFKQIPARPIKRWLIQWINDSNCMICIKKSAIQLRQLICLVLAHQRVDDLIDIPGQDIVELI